MNEDKLKELRQSINSIDDEMIALFARRMAVSGEVAEVKRKNNIAITDSAREDEVVERCVKAAGGENAEEVTLFMRSVMALSKKHQRERLLPKSELLPAASGTKTGAIKCVYQGTAGAWSEQALIAMYPATERAAVRDFEDVFTAVKSGGADYGVLPIENSQTGAIGEVYDLLKKHGCYIVGQVRIDIKHCLMANRGVTEKDIKEVYSHPEGFKQCSRFLKLHGWDLSACRNTAIAAETVKNAGAEQSGRVAAIGSKRAAEVFGLHILNDNIVDSAGNSTRFVAVAAAPEYDGGSNILSFTFSTAHRSGALCEALMPLIGAGANLSRIESRPAMGGKYRFFADISGNIADEKIVLALRGIAAATDYFEVLGCYSECRDFS